MGFRVTASQRTAVVLAGGLGTRLRSVVNDRPKVLATVRGRPFLTFVLDQIHDVGCRNIIISIGYLGDQIARAVGDTYRGMKIDYAHEEVPLGTGGALQCAARQAATDDVLVFNGDSYAAIDLNEFVSWRDDAGFANGIATLRVQNCDRFGTVEADERGAILRFFEKTGRPEPGIINSGIYLLRRDALANLDLATPFSLERDVFPTWISTSFGARAFDCPFVDIGTPESFASADEFFSRLLQGSQA